MFNDDLINHRVSWEKKIQDRDITFIPNIFYSKIFY